MARGSCPPPRKGTRHRGVHLSRRLRGREKTASLEVLPGRKEAPTGNRGRRFRPPRGAGLPHGQRILLPPRRRNLGRGLQPNQILILQSSCRGAARCAPPPHLPFHSHRPAPL